MVKVLEPQILEEASQEFMERHHLHGLRYSLFKKEKDRSEWRKQWIKNKLVKKELDIIGSKIQVLKIDGILLKGFALLGDVYRDWGARFASDVDILINKKDFSQMQQILRSQGFVERDEEYWLGNDFKRVFTKNSELFEIVIELHFDLFWHQPLAKRFYRPSSQVEGFQLLSLEAQLLHLCGHFAFQHNFLKLFWLFDIQAFVEKYQHRLDWSYLWHLAKENHLKLSVLCCLKLIDEGEEWYSKMSKDLTLKESIQLKALFLVLGDKFLISPRSKPIHYFICKMLIKDQIRYNYQYIRAWIKKYL